MERIKKDQGTFQLENFVEGISSYRGILSVSQSDRKYRLLGWYFPLFFSRVTYKYCMGPKSVGLLSRIMCVDVCVYLYSILYSFTIKYLKASERNYSICKINIKQEGVSFLYIKY